MRCDYDQSGLRLEYAGSGQDAELGSGTGLRSFGVTDGMLRCSQQPGCERA